jgi:hypothetical protein
LNMKPGSNVPIGVKESPKLQDRLPSILKKDNHLASG